jgi:hypothetical protein
MSDGASRHELLARAQRDSAALEQALAELRRAAQRPFAITDRIREELHTHPARWLAVAVLAGLWWGRRV